MKFTTITKIKFMSHVKIKTTYEYQLDGYGSTGTETIYCHHNLSSDFITFYNEDGSIVDMIFQKWSTGKDKWDAVMLLMRPFKDKWGHELKEGVEYTKFPFDDN